MATARALRLAVLYDGKISRVCIDTSGVGDLASPKLIGEYSETHEYATLSADQFNIAIHVWDDGKILMIMSMCSKHNTYMAETSLAYYRDEPERNGVAPAEGLSLRICDLCVASTEAGAAFTGAMIQVMHNKSLKARVMYMSYVDHPHYSVSGQVIDMSELTDKYGPVWICAGNENPALTTISSAPNVNSNALIGVGAYVSPEMMVAEDSLHSKLPETSTTWISRGPCPTGESGVNICAPGAAVTSVPQFLLCNRILMNGTSMSSLHVLVVVAALLLSGVVQRKMPYTPHPLECAPENACQPIENQVKYGQNEGLVKIEKSFEHLVAYHNQPDYRFC